MKLRAMFSAVVAALGLTDEQKVKADTAIGALPDVDFDGDKKPEDKKTQDKKPDEGTKQENEALKAMLAKSNEALDALTKRFADQDAATTANAKIERDKSITALIEAAKKDGRIAAQNAVEVDRWTKLLNADLDTAKAALESVPKTVNSAATGGTDGKTNGAKPRGADVKIGMDSLRESAASAFSMN